MTALERVIEIKEESAERLLAQDAKGKSCTVSILGYGSANEDRKAGPLMEDVDEKSTSAEKSKADENETRSKGTGKE